MKKIILLIGIVMILLSGCDEVIERVHYRGEPCDVDYDRLMECNVSRSDPYPECARLYEQEMDTVKIKGYCKNGTRIGGVG